MARKGASGLRRTALWRLRDFGGVAATSAAFTVLLLASPLIGQASASTVVTPPFGWAPVSSSWDFYSSGSPTYRILATPFFHPHSGYGGFAASVATPKCHGTCGQTGYIDGYVSLYLPIPAIANATSVLANWTMAF